MRTPIDDYITVKTSSKRVTRGDVLENANIDWGKPYRQIAEEFGVGIMAVFVEYRRRFGTKRKHIRITPPTQKKSWEKFKNWDWSKRNGQLAKEHGITRERVRQIRKGLGIPRCPKKVGKLNDVDWSKSDDQIAQETGLTIQFVHAKRLKVARDTAQWFQKRQRFQAVLKSFSAEDWEKFSRRDILRRAQSIEPGINAEYMRRFANRNGIKRKPSRWDSKDRYLSLPLHRMTSLQVAERLNITRNAVYLWTKRNRVKLKEDK